MKPVAALAGRLRLDERWRSVRRDMPAIFAEGRWRPGDQAWLASLIRTARGAADDDYGKVASAIAFSSFLALRPLLGAIVLVYGMVTPTERVAENVRTLPFIPHSPALDVPVGLRAAGREAEYRTHA